MAAARLRCAAAIAVATATPAVAAPPLRRHPAFLPVPGAARLRLTSCRIPPPRGAAAAAMSSSARAEHEAGAWYAVPGLSLRDHRFAVPLDHSSPDSGATITVFAREVVAGRSRLLVQLSSPSSACLPAICRTCSVLCAACSFCWMLVWVCLFVKLARHHSLDSDMNGDKAV